MQPRIGRRPARPRASCHVRAPHRRPAAAPQRDPTRPGRATPPQALKYGFRTHISSCGALVTISGQRDVWKTGRSPKDKRVVREPSTQDDIWWAQPGSGSPNYEMDER
jgi:hypothetical protein